MMNSNSQPEPSNAEIQEIREHRLQELAEASKLAKMPLSEAAMAWLDSRRPFLDERTAKDYEYYIANITKLFGNLRLEQLANPDRVRAFQRQRSQTCGPRVVNRECSIIQQMLKRIGKWEQVRPFYQPLPLPRESPGRAMTPEEERKLLEAGASNSAWAVAYWATTLAINTSAGPLEVCALRLRDVFVNDAATARIYIREHVKNEHRVREIPLNPEAYAAARSLVERARSLGATQPEDYLFPYRTKRNRYDPTRHGFWPRSAFHEMRAAAGIKLRPYDLRHHALTKLAETQPEHVVLKIAGHVSTQMLRKVYAHVRLPALRAAVNGISAINPDRTAAAREKTAQPKPDQASFDQVMMRVAELAKQMGVPEEKALQLVLEYERQQAPRKKA